MAISPRTRFLRCSATQPADPEATQQLPDNVKQAHDAIPWKEIIGFRNILVHSYLGNIDPQTVLAVLEHNLAPLKAAIEAMLAEHGDEP